MNRFFVTLAAVSLTTAALAYQARTTSIPVESSWHESAGENRSKPDQDFQSTSRESSETSLPNTQMLPNAQKGRRATLAVTPKKKAGPLMLSFTELKWADLSERKGMQFALLSGDPTKGAYTQMRRVRAGTDNPLHRHSSEIKNVIISGVWYTGVDAASAGDFGPGSIVIMPANWKHVSGCRSGSDCVFYQEGKGRFDFKAVASAAAKAKPDNR